ncbi:MAG: IPT/TIG domain-containing protein [Acidimicrobiales bacterium]
MNCRFCAVLGAVIAVLFGAVSLGVIGNPPSASAASNTWSIATSPNTSTSQSNSLNKVSCISASWCTAVGYYYVTGTTGQTLIEQWNGSTWSIATSPNTSTSQSNFLNGVSCTSASMCVAVGEFMTGTVDQTLIEQWNGSTWSIATSPNTSTSENNSLEGVSCTSVSACTAVGDYYDGSADQTLIEQWNGSTWSIDTSPNTSTSEENNLNGVSCTSASACTAVGNYDTGTAYQTLIEQWNGSTWSIATSPNTSTSQGNYLEGVSCTSTSACTAAGEYYLGTTGLTLVEQWNGNTWSIVTSPNVSNSQESFFYEVSCTSTSACTAAGGASFTSSADQTLIEQWNGSTWSIVTSPDTSTSQGDSLEGVSCTSTSACAAVGSYDGSADQTLILMTPGIPVVNAVSPTSGPTTGGTTVTISGSNFLGATAADFGSVAAPSFTVTSDTSMTVTAPPHGAGIVDVTVTSPRGTSSTSSGDQFAYPGYDLAGADGGVFVFPVGQSSGFYGSLPGLGVKVSNIVGIVPTNHFTGYDLVGSDGGAFVFPTGQSAGFYGSLPGLGVKVSNIVGIVPTDNFQGYDLVGSDGGVFVFPTGQSAGFFGSLPALGVHVNDIVGIVATPGGGGYFLVGKDGGVFTFGNAPFLGSLPGIGVSVSDITGIASTQDGNGYYVVGANGGVYAFGDATSYGSLPGLGVSVSNIVSIVPTPDGKGYWLVGSDGGVFAFGDATSQGSLPGLGVSVNDVVGAVPTG